MIRRIYHGSSQIIRPPRFGAGYPFNDFGLGFYCTDSIRLAGEWAVSRSSNGFISKYSIQDTGLRIIDLGSPQYTLLHWLSVLINYREFDTASSAAYQGKEYIRTTFPVDIQNSDCIIGFRADNCNFTFAQDFLNGKISYEELCDLVIAGGTGRQFVLKSNRAFDRIVFDGFEPALSNDFYPVRASRDLAAMKRSLSSDRKSGGLYISRIIEERMTAYDQIIRRY